MRCVLAVFPPAGVVDDITGFLEPRRTATQGMPWRWTRPGSHHITLAFMADYPDQRVEELSQGLDAWARRRAPLTMTVSGAGAFPNPERARVLYLGVPGEAAVRLGEWSQQLRALVTHHGGSPDGMGFTPHLTVARANRGQRGGRLVQALDTYASAVFTVSEVALVESHLGERRHEVLHRASLSGV